MFDSNSLIKRRIFYTEAVYTFIFLLILKKKITENAIKCNETQFFPENSNLISKALNPSIQVF